MITDDQVRTALVQDGLSHGRPEAISFIRRAIGANPFAKGLDLRRFGDQAAPDVLRSLGVRAGAALTTEFLEILTDKGRADPIEAAQFITSAYQAQVRGQRNLDSYRQVGIDWVEVIPNNMAAGPCAACLSLVGRRIPVSEAPIGPLPTCPHPSQCAIRTAALLD